MRITIEVPDDQVPYYYISKIYPSGYGEDDLHHLLIESAILHKLRMLQSLLASKDDIPAGDIEQYEDTCEMDVEFLRLLQQSMKIESGDSKEKVLIDGLTDVAQTWYDGCPKSMKFVTRVLQLLKEYKAK